MDPSVVERARRLHGAVEPVAQLGFHAYEQRRPSVRVSPMEWYFGGRVACLGAIGGEAAVALLGVLEPSGVVSGLDATWRITDPATLVADRADAVGRMLEGAIDRSFDVDTVSSMLRRAVDALEPAGHVLFAGWRSFGSTGDPLADLWLRCVALREHRGAAHIAAWRARGLSPVDILVLTEAWRDLPLGSHATTMGWRPDQVHDGIDRLTRQGWIADGCITAAGATARNDIEEDTDRQEEPAVRALGDDLEGTCAALQTLVDGTRR